MNKKSIVSAVVVLLVLLAFAAVLVFHFYKSNREEAHQANAALAVRNPELDYQMRRYDIPVECQEEAFRNLSRTNAPDKAQPHFATGWKILTGTDDMAAFQASYEAVRELYLQSERSYDRDGSDCQILSGTEGVLDPAFDEAFFAENDLLLVDFCAEGAITLYFYPENLKIDGATVSLDVRWDRDNAWTGGCAGQYCLITIPKGCTTA